MTAFDDALAPVAGGGTARFAGWAMAVVAVSMALVSLVLVALNRDQVFGSPAQAPFLTLVGQVAGPHLAVIISSALGAVILSRERHNALGWALSATSVALALTLVTQQYALYGLVVSPGGLPSAVIAAWIQDWLFLLLPLCIMCCVFLFPDGRLASSWWWVPLGLGIVVTALGLFDSLANPYPLTTFGRSMAQPLPVTMPPALWAAGGLLAIPTGAVAYWGLAVMVPAAGLGLVLRLRGASGDRRLQVKWLVFSVAVAASGWLLGYAADIPIPALAGDQLVQAIATGGKLLWLSGISIATPLAGAVAVLKYRLYDIDLVISRTLMVAGLAVFITGVYVAIVIRVGGAVGTGYGSALSLVAAAIIAVAFAPVRDWVQTVANRLVYGRRSTPYETLTAFAERLGNADLNDDVLAQMARLVGEGTAAERAEVWLRVGSELRRSAAWPPAPADLAPLPVAGEALTPIVGRDRALPVRDRGELLGALAVTTAHRERWESAQDKLLADLARQAGLILRNVRLVEELRSSRERIVKAQDEERRRLERNLHDGAQQRLVTASMMMGMERSAMRAGRVAELGDDLNDASRHLKDGLAELRTLARGLHPVILTDSGLPAALESLVEGSAVPATLESILDRRYPAPVEATAYYVVAEALTNAARHANASAVVVRAREEEGRLVIEVADDGAGGADLARGSGLRGLQDRVAALGGCLHLESAPGRGTTLRAELSSG
jgi:signal transduction histidine kinase